MAIESMNECNWGLFCEYVHIMCDSQSAISAFTVQNQLNQYRKYIKGSHL